ncbi:MAG TPA: HDOD domain-containing protein [Candidatus Limnocylindrales bacterium]|nr:HDOD domain-containing protein [Candidatus Limnocylindrales bacterium]
MHLNLDPRDTICVARQPIVDQSGKVFGYELLYRGGTDDTTCTAAGDLAAARVFNDAVLNLGLDTLTAGHLAFVNLTRPLLVDDAATLLPPSATVLEVREDVPIDGAVLEACRRLHGLGYALALDDFTADSDAEALLPFAKFVKVDVLSTPIDAWARLARRLLSGGVRLIAEKAETADVVQTAGAAGYTLFQGYFFCKPRTFSAAAVPARRLAYLNLLAALSRPDLTVSQLENLVKHDVSLSYRVLRCINSAAFGLRQEIRSIRQALVMLGTDRIRKWASVWSLAGLNSGTPETVTVALLRARCCELVGEALSGAEAGSEFFLLGLCSLLDAMLDRPMANALSDMPLPAPIRDALLGASNAARSVLDLVVAYERGAWDEAEGAATAAGLPAAALPAAYADGLRWARELSQTSLAA